MSSNTNTHHTYNTYTHKPSDGPPAPGVDHNMDDGLDKQRRKAEEEVKAHEDRKPFKKYHEIHYFLNKIIKLFLSLRSNLLIVFK